MLTRLHFIAGLPRSGSTLLSALLRQNPRFTAGVTSPLASLCGALLHKMSGASEFSVFFSDERRARVIRGIFASYYHDIPDGHVVFDTNRSWTSRVALLDTMFPESRIICCVRDVPWIIDSIERLMRKNALQPSRMFDFSANGNIYTRAEILMDPEKGLVGFAWGSLREAWFGDLANKLIIVQYESLVGDPGRVMEKLYHALNEPFFRHDFDNIIYDEPDYDANLGAPGLHAVKRHIRRESRMLSIPPDILGKFADASFWANPKLNSRKVLVL